ncbi:hypothetical protein SAMN02746065_11665 [Desulfocicer vacuolatum DSM 3385]|uniref:Recombinase n=1 Tax=Desulfocicer vacuolatum DSM 3385 TaxID=1121400 RepID=A0A1W2DAG9_9BACT|nr:hypothetical protein [Desulfocicer vacuolatum]SMC94490.1 hypothetical protein SAMN02746065_11665 [Desulfocicer vacuolatum DSM 3385]
MNDFLQSLRGGQKDKRTPKTRRGFDNNSNPHYNQNPNYSSGGYQNVRGGNVKRVTRSNSPAKYPAQDIEMSAGYDEFLERALDVLDGFLKNQERLVDIEQRRVLIEERKADALEEIVAHLQMNAQPGELMEGYPAPEDDMMPEQDVAPDVMDGDFHAKDGMEDPNPMVHHNFQESTHRQGRMVDPLSYASGASVTDQPGRFDGDLFSSGNAVPSREKKESPVKTSHKKVEPSSAPGKKRISRSTEKKEVKVIKRSRADKAKGGQGKVKVADSKGSSASLEGVLPREEVMKIIETMREKGATFDQVATYLVSINQPTFSGRGEWHAQTVHRLCNRKK